jgi:hypothetical protein
MTSKRDTKNPADVLHRVIEGLEAAPSPQNDLTVIAELVSHGPFVCPGGLTDAVARFAEHVNTCEELRRFVRVLVQARDSGQFEGHLSTAVAAPVTFSALTEKHGRVRIAATGHVRDQTVLQLILLIDQVGLSQIRQCPAPNCPRIFVKRHRSKFCSKTCQRRDEVQRRRSREREQRVDADRRKRLHVVRRGV